MTVRRRRILYSASSFFAVLALGAVLIYFILLPWIVRNRFTALLRAQGLEQFTFHVPVATVRSAWITDVKIGTGDNHIDRLIVRYGVSSLSGGRIDSLRVEGLNLVMNVAADGTVDLGPLAPLVRRTRPQPATRPAEPAAIPVNRIELATSQITIKSPTNETTIPLTGSASSSNGFLYKINFQTELGSPLVVTGDADPSKADVHLTLAAEDADARALTRLASAFIPGLSVGLQGRLQTHAIFNRDNARSTLDAQLKATAATTSPSPTDPNVQLSSGVFHIVGVFGPAESSMHLKMQDVSLTERSQSMQIDGVLGEVSLIRFVPLTSPPAQIVKVKTAKIGELTLIDGTVEFQVIGPQSIQIEHTQWNTLGGQVLANHATIQNGNVEMMLQARHVDLEKVLALFAKDKAAGKGFLSGNIQIAYTNNILHILSGQLQSTGTGTLQVNEAEDIAGEVAKGLSKGTAQQQVKAELVQSLKDFQFTQITGELRHEQPGLVGHVRIKGHGRTGAKVPILYDLNLFGLEPLIRSTLRLREGLASPHNGQGKAQ